MVADSEISLRLSGWFKRELGIKKFLNELTSRSTGILENDLSKLLNSAVYKLTTHSCHWESWPMNTQILAIAIAPSPKGRIPCKVLNSLLNQFFQAIRHPQKLRLPRSRLDEDEAVYFAPGAFASGGTLNININNHLPTAAESHGMGRLNRVSIKWEWWRWEQWWWEG